MNPTQSGEKNKGLHGELLAQLPAFLTLKQKSEPAWLHAQRLANAELLKTDEIPTARQEAWKYFKSAQLNLGELAPPQAAAQAPPPQKNPITTMTGATFSFVDGHFSPELSSAVLPEGLQIQLNGKDAPAALPNSGFFSLLNQTYFDQVFTLEVTSAFTGRELIHFRFHCSDNGRGRLNCPRVKVIATENAQAAVVETFENLNLQNLSVALIDFELRNGAKVHHLRLAPINAVDARRVSHTTIMQARDSFFESAVLMSGEIQSHHEILARLQGPGAEISLRGVTLVRDQQSVDCVTDIRHESELTTSSQNFKAIAANQGRSNFLGQIQIAKLAQKSNAAQLCNNLILGDKAEANAKPELAIFADDVKASHGATFGQIDPEQVFYLQSRGYSLQEATTALVNGFAESVALQITEPRLQLMLQDEIKKQLRLVSLVRK